MSVKDKTTRASSQPPLSSSSQDAASDSWSTTNSSMETQMEHVLQLMNDRASGLVTNEQVEVAVARLVTGVPLPAQQHASPPQTDTGVNSGMPSRTTTTSVETSRPANSNPVANRGESAQIQPDTEDYDNIEEEDGEEGEGDKEKEENTKGGTKKRSSTGQSSKKSPAKKRRGRRSKKSAPPDPRDKSEEDTANVTIDWSIYQDIPLGKQGAQMMTSFGDGRRPQPATVEAALLGARRMLQVAIQDARHIRRKHKKIYMETKTALQHYRFQPTSNNTNSSTGGTGNSTTLEVSSPELLYRAYEGYDRLAYDPKCGFDLDELRQLYPEEMNAYLRWNEMHTESTDLDPGLSTGISLTPNDGEDDNPSVLEVPDGNIPSDEDGGGHLHQRAQQFDLRTDRMNDDWYLKFSEVRQGSFLPRRRHLSSEDREWEATRSQKQGDQQGGNSSTQQEGRSRGRKVSPSGWASMSAPTVRFLHWVGFDPQSGLPPPNEETAEALAFLGYDFLGRIVEKAILLRNEAELADDSGKFLLELPAGQQLDPMDIERAMSDPEIKPVPLFSASAEKTIGSQLYFGPGFEDRLEMEMDEMMMAHYAAAAAEGRAGESTVVPGWSEEELQIRRKEDELFAQLAAPPTKGRLSTLLAFESNATAKEADPSAQGYENEE